VTSPFRLRSLLLAPLLAVAVLAGATTLGPAVASASTTTHQSAHRVSGRTQAVLHAAAIALRHRGAPYRYGAAGPRAFDCSGLMYFAFRHAGIAIPRTSSAQAHRAHRIPKSHLHRGDLMFFTSGGRVYHAAMFLRWSHGHAVMLHAPRPGQRVRIDRPWTSSWFAATLR
jgi:cell wall-associated NlpC family hydrolase